MHHQLLHASHVNQKMPSKHASFIAKLPISGKEHTPSTDSSQWRRDKQSNTPVVFCAVKLFENALVKTQDHSEEKPEPAADKSTSPAVSRSYMQYNSRNRHQSPANSYINQLSPATE